MADFNPGYLTLVMYLSDIGEINSTVFHSDNLTSVTRLRIDSAGVTGIAEGALGSFQNLTSISLKKNALTQMNSNWFGRPFVLSELSLTENQIEVVSESMLNGFLGLTKLSLNKNRIRTIGPNSFRSQTNLSELDLSENRMTRVSPQVFRSLRSTRIRLDGNPWDCSCGAEDFAAFLKDLQSRSLLDRQMEVTCESPPSLRGRRVWDVSVCAASPAPGSPSVHPTPADALTTIPASSAKAVTRTEPADAAVTITSHPATPPARPTSADNLLETVPAQSATSVISPPSETETFTPPHTGLTDTCETSEPPSDTTTVCTLVVVILVLCVLLSVVCFLAAQHRRKRNNKTVMPGRPKEETNKLEEDSRSNHDQAPGHSENWHPEVSQERPFTGVRAKSANAVLSMSPFCVSGKDRVALQNETEAQSKDAENRADGEQTVENEVEATGGIQKDEITNTTDTTEKNEKRSDAGRNLDGNPQCVSAKTDTVPYLSIGTNQNKPNPESTDGVGHRSQLGTVMGRVSTWPLTAAQWQARCKMKEEEEEENEVNKTGNKVEHPSTSDRDKKEDEKLNYKTPSVRDAHAHTGTKQKDPASVRLTISKTLGPNQEKLRPAENPAHETPSTSSRKAEQRKEPKRAGTSRQLAGDRSAGSKAPSGGASPDDETLLYGNEYAFMDLLHEVVQNNGRWTRERWRQIHVNKQRR
ncbi:uncharacterized protein LOC120804907 [Xiphias gladius]|uniref:uncharacterized protein LOC120804907 n=1 Tax=Xiphias gladius TaxID=8245 RepID=UPI001A991545|nr:uncharacterized protein LOC120804907 [Xiphias gladius]